MKNLLTITAVLCLCAGTAFAQDDEMGGDESTDTSGESTESTDTSSDSGGGGEMAATTSDAGGMAGPGAQMGISVGLNSAGDAGTANILYNLGGNYLDLSVQLDFANAAPDEGDGVTTFDIGVGAGYRMYKAMDSRIHPYLEPFALVALGSDGNDDSDDPVVLGAGAAMGVDFLLFDQFTLGAAVGAQLFYTINDPNVAGGAGSSLTFGLFTSAINATFWWG